MILGNAHLKRLSSWYKQRTDVELCVSNIDSQSNQEDNFKVHDTQLFSRCKSIMSIQFNIGWEVNITCQPPIGKQFKFKFSGNNNKYIQNLCNSTYTKVSKIYSQGMGGGEWENFLQFIFNSSIHRPPKFSIAAALLLKISLP